MIRRCSVEGCDRPHKAHGLCRRCYEASRRAERKTAARKRRGKSKGLMSSKGIPLGQNPGVGPEVTAALAERYRDGRLSDLTDAIRAHERARSRAERA